MLNIENIINAIEHNADRIRDIEEGLFVELPDGNIVELCNVTFINGRVVLKTEIQIN